MKRKGRSRTSYDMGGKMLNGKRLDDYFEVYKIEPQNETKMEAT